MLLSAKSFLRELARVLICERQLASASNDMQQPFSVTAVAVIAAFAFEPAESETAGAAQLANVTLSVLRALPPLGLCDLLFANERPAEATQWWQAGRGIPPDLVWNRWHSSLLELVTNCLVDVRSTAEASSHNAAEFGTPEQSPRACALCGQPLPIRLGAISSVLRRFLQVKVRKPAHFTHGQFACLRRLPHVVRRKTLRASRKLIRSRAHSLHPLLRAQLRSQF